MVVLRPWLPFSLAALRQSRTIYGGVGVLLGGAAICTHTPLASKILGNEESTLRSPSVLRIAGTLCEDVMRG